MNICAYARVSTDSEDQANSYENQHTYFTREIVSKGHTLYKIYADKGLTGTKLNNRPEFEKMLTDAGIDIINFNSNGRDLRSRNKHTVYGISERKPLFDEIWIKNTSRFARNTLSSEIITMLRQKNVNIFFLEQNINTNNMSQDLLLKLIAVFDETESKDRSLKVKTGLHESIRNGRINTNGKLFGYNYITGENRLEENPEEAAIVRTVFEMYSNGKGQRQIAKYLTEQGILTRKGGEFGKSSIRQMLTNEKYMGINNGMKYDTGVVFQKYFSAKIKEKYQLIPSDRIPALISPELFEKCKVVNESKTTHILQKGIYNGISKYGGLIKCGKCGKPYYGNNRRGVRFYNCSTKKSYGVAVCDALNIYENELDEFFARQAKGGFKEAFETEKTVSIQKVYAEILRQYKEIDSDNSGEIKNVIQEENELLERLDGYRELYIISKANRENMKIKIEDIENQIDEVQKKHTELTRNNMDIANAILDLFELSKRIRNITDDKKTYTAEEVASECESITLMSLPLPNGSVQRTFALNIKKLNDIQEVTKNLPQVLNEYIESKDIVQIVNEMTKLKNNL